MYRGARDGDWLQFTLGAGSLVLDIATMGGASVIKAAAVTTVAVAAGYGARALAKRAGKEVVEEVGERIAINTVGAMRRESNLVEQADNLIPLNGEKIQ
jgi:hypothetical protein